MWGSYNCDVSRGLKFENRTAVPPCLHFHALHHMKPQRERSDGVGPGRLLGISSTYFPSSSYCRYLSSVVDTDRRCIMTIMGLQPKFLGTAFVRFVLEPEIVAQCADLLKLPTRDHHLTEEELTILQSFPSNCEQPRAKATNHATAPTATMYWMRSFTLCTEADMTKKPVKTQARIPKRIESNPIALFL